MVPDLQQIGPEARPRREERPLGLVLGVPDEQRRPPPEVDPHHQRRVVGGGLRPHARAGGQHLHARLSEHPRLSAEVRRPPDRRAPRARGAEERRIRPSHVEHLPQSALPQLPERHVVRDCRQPREVIRVRVRERQHVHPRSPPRREHRQDHARPWIHRVSDHPAPVHEHAPPVREIDEDRVSLPHVERRDSQSPPRSPRPDLPDLEHEQRPQGRRHDRQALSPPPAHSVGRHADHERRELHGGGRRHPDAPSDRRRPPRDPAHDEQRPGPREREPPLQRPDRRNSRVRKAHGERHHLSDRRRQDVREHPQQRQPRREPQQRRRRSHSRRERRPHGPEHMPERANRGLSNNAPESRPRFVGGALGPKGTSLERPRRVSVATPLALPGAVAGAPAGRRPLLRASRSFRRALGVVLSAVR